MYPVIVKACINCIIHVSIPTQVLGYVSSSELSHDDMYVIADAALENKDYGLAAQWYTKAVESRDTNFSTAEAYVKLGRANKEVN